MGWYALELSEAVVDISAGQIDGSSDLFGGGEHGSSSGGRVHKDLCEPSILDVPKRGDDGKIIQASEARHLLELLGFGHLLFGREVVFLEVDKRNVPVSTFSDQFRNFLDRVVKVVWGEGDADIGGRVEFEKVTNLVRGGEHGILVVLDRHGDAKLLRQFIVRLELLEKSTNLRLSFRSDRVFRAHFAGGTDSHLSSNRLHPPHLVVLSKGAERVTGRNP